MNGVHFVGKVAQKVIIARSEKVLIVRDSRDPNTWQLPGGRLNEGERPEEGIAREVQEELGVLITQIEPVYVGVQVHKRDGSTMLVLVYKAVLCDENAHFQCDEVEIAEMEWVSRQTWSHYHFFPEYQAALEVYFRNT
jgi:ADP-ribose pyrophosphatase YjhB (NUDIX family)